MPSDDLSALYRLHRIDRELVELKARLAAYDPTREVRAEVDAFRPDYDAAMGAYKTSKAEAEEIERQQAACDEKLKRLDKELYGGKVVNPREVAAMETEIGHLKARRAELDERLLALWDAMPPLEAEARQAQKRMKGLKERFEALKAEGLAEQQRIKVRYSALAKDRPGAAAGVSKGLLAQYEAIRNRAGGIGMAEVTDGGACGMCGTQLPTRTLDAVSRDLQSTCESCHRILIQVLADG